MTKTFKLGAAAYACAALMALAVPVSAQSVLQDSGPAGADIFARDQAVTVRDRPRPDYDAIGVRTGGFLLFPRLQTEAEYSDNIFATQAAKVDDVIVRVRPEVNWRSDWSRNSLNLFARSTSNIYTSTSSQNTTDWTVGGAGRYDGGGSVSLAAAGDVGRYTEARTSVSTQQLSRKPIRYNQAQVNLSAATVLNRLKLSGRADYARFNYDDGRTAGGLVLEQDDRDRKVTSATGRADYAVSPATALFVQVTGNKRNYRNEIVSTVPVRDSSGYEALGGVNFEVTALLRGEIAAGYIRQSFDNRAYKTIGGFGARGQVEWLPTELTTVTLKASRTIEDAGIIGSAGYLSNQLGLQVDHEFLRNLILSGTATYGRDRFKDLSRTDDRWSAGASATYLLDRHFGATLSYNHLDRNSNVAFGQNYSINRFTISLVSQF